MDGDNRHDALAGSVFNVSGLAQEKLSAMSSKEISSHSLQEGRGRGERPKAERACEVGTEILASHT